MAEPSILAIDPGSRVAGVALYTPIRRAGTWQHAYALDAVYTIQRVDYVNVQATLEWALDVAPFPLRLVVEDQFMGGKLRGASFRTLIKSAVRWEIQAEGLNIAKSTVYPAAWQSRVLKGLPKALTTKERSRLVVKSVFGLDVGEDAADATCIGLYTVQTLEAELGGHIDIERASKMQGPA